MMEDFFWIFISAAVTALALENAVFARALGLGRESMFINSPRAGILFGGALTWMATLSALPVSLINERLADAQNILIIRPVAYLLSIFAIYAGTILLTGKYMKNKRLADEIHRVLPISTFNSALFAAFYLSASQGFTFPQTTGYALGAGLGYTGAILIIYYAHKRLAISSVPRSFRGLPILLIYLGLISLALYGLIGHDLPT